MMNKKIVDSIKTKILTCTTTARIQNVDLKYNLHSHALNYGSGSGQQAVTGLESDTDVGSLWTFKESSKDKMCLTGAPIPCGSSFRLEHMGTTKNLHSHQFQSPVSGRQEVSAFGDNGEGDEGDDWIIECKDSLIGDLIDGKTLFYLKHKVSSHYLTTDARSMFTQQNCRNCPIVDQAEISGTKAKNKRGLWKLVGGYFFAKDNLGDYGLGELINDEEVNYDDDYMKEDL
mmetsp:Transcript_24951/g.27615  ORF Transcript_24951/g.27615 Transcript_24951/m.27615 type:complete len:230 (+) Transcript_24951:62-751(+)